MYGERARERKQTTQFAKSTAEFRASLESRLYGTSIKIGVHGEMETPVPIPNTEAKHLIGYNTWVLTLGR